MLMRMIITQDDDIDYVFYVSYDNVCYDYSNR